jgi:hypothetical protein
MLRKQPTGESGHRLRLARDATDRPLAQESTFELAPKPRSLRLGSTTRHELRKGLLL